MFPRRVSEARLEKEKGRNLGQATRICDRALVFLGAHGFLPLALVKFFLAVTQVVDNWNGKCIGLEETESTYVPGNWVVMSLRAWSRMSEHTSFPVCHV